MTPLSEPMMSRRIVIALLFAVAQQSQAQQPAAPQLAPMSAEECAVWERERSFAAALEAHDAAAFAAHLHAGAVFIGGRGELSRGAEAVQRDWSAAIRGEGFQLRWYPQRVVIGGDPDVAHSRGPFWIESSAPDGTPRFVLGQFVSVWRRVDGEWKVLFDGGGGRPEPASVAEIGAMQAGLEKECPRAP
jgi:ketosteroid isomerase-like protein